MWNNQLTDFSREIRGDDYVETEESRPMKDSKWLSSIPFAKRFGCRSVRKSQVEKYESKDEHDLQGSPSPVGRSSISEDSSAEPPAYSKEAFNENPLGAEGNVVHPMPEHNPAKHATQSEHTHKNEKDDDTPAFPVPHPNV